MSKRFGDSSDLDSFMRSKNRASKKPTKDNLGYPCPECGEPNLSVQEVRLKKSCKQCDLEKSNNIPDEIA